MILLARILAAFSAYGKKSQIAFAMAIGFSLAIVPGGNLLWIVLFLPLLLVRINQAGMLGTLALARLFVHLFDPAIERFGFFLLNRPVLENIMTRILVLPFVGWLRLDDSFVFGGLIAGILILPLAFGAFFALVLVYRNYCAPRVNRFFRKISAAVPWVGRLGKTVVSLRDSLA